MIGAIRVNVECINQIEFVEDQGKGETKDKVKAVQGKGKKEDIVEVVQMIGGKSSRRIAIKRYSSLLKECKDGN